MIAQSCQEASRLQSPEQEGSGTGGVALRWNLRLWPASRGWCILFHHQCVSRTAYMEWIWINPLLVCVPDSAVRLGTLPKILLLSLLFEVSSQRGGSAPPSVILSAWLFCGIRRKCLFYGRFSYVHRKGAMALKVQKWPLGFFLVFYTKKSDFPHRCFCVGISITGKAMMGNYHTIGISLSPRSLQGRKTHASQHQCHF